VGAAQQTVPHALDLYNQALVDSLAAMYAEDDSFVSLAGPVRGRTQIAEALRGERVAFSTLSVTALRWVEDGHVAVLEYTATGQHPGPMPAPDGSMLPPTGHTVTFDGLDVLEVRHGVIVHDHRYYDMLPVALQLGVVRPAPPPGGAAATSAATPAQA
jgi:hypothetical protein